MRKPPKPAARAKHDIKVLAKVFEILEALHRLGDAGGRLSKIASRVAFPKPTVFRVLRTLERLGYVLFDGPLETYRIAQRLKDLGQSRLSEVIGRLGRPAMMRLLAEFEQTVNLAVFENDTLIYRDMLEGLRSVRMQPVPGTYLSITQSALGKSILAYLPEEEVLSIVNHQSAKKLPKDEGNPAELLFRELQKVRKQGYAVDDQQVERGLRCVGAPIFNKDGRPVASISVSGSSSVLSQPEIQRIGRKTKEVCAEISLALGYSPVPEAVKK